MGKLVELLIKKQEEMNLSETEFANKLGMSRPMWYLVKSGNRQPGKKFLKATMKAFPELQLDVMNCMRG